ncbi:stonustoxin subunit beta-like [Micropterus dolomieu]|uniref:stonustoxin subunit beta-like n=1 Tax=Micropterus dolomieu TaxID=147949 RepID=UPI001E8D9DCC|nr:stonustoxin subunit beta-like [Micropterus dolomieu]
MVIKDVSDPPPSFRMKPGEVRWLRPDLMKYSCEFTLDINTANGYTKLYDNNRTAAHVQDDQLYPDHADRFDRSSQVMCTNGVTGRCYWEVEWREKVAVSVSYRGIRRKGNSKECWFGCNDKSWRLDCSDDGYSVFHRNRETSISSASSSFSSNSGRVAVYVDYAAGTLSFFRVSSDTLIHLHTFNTTFTEPLYPGFGLWHRSGSSVSL